MVTQLMQVVGLIFAGGLLLLWVRWKMYREIRHVPDNPGTAENEAAGAATRQELRRRRLGGGASPTSR